MRITLPVRPGSAAGVRPQPDATQNDATTAWYLGYRLLIREKDVAVFSPAGMLVSVQPSVRFARLLVRRVRRLKREAAAG